MIKRRGTGSVLGAMVLSAVLLSACGADGGGGEDGGRSGSDGSQESSTTTIAPVTTATTAEAAPTTPAPTTAAPTTAAPTTAAPPTTAPPLPLPGSEAVAACGPPAGTWTVTTFTTARFTVHICESTLDGTLYYRGRNRENGDRIDLPADYAGEDLAFAADNGEFQYYVDRNALLVYKGDELILEEPVLSVS